MDHSTPIGNDLTSTQKEVVLKSMCCTLMSKVKFLLQNPLKNKQFAQNQNLLSVIELIAENLLPHYCAQNSSNSQKLSYMHSLCFLLASKIQSVLTSGVIKTCIDQNWDLKGLKAVLLRVLNELGSASEDCKKLQEVFDKMIQSQNLQSQSCIKVISYYLKNRNKSQIDEDDLKNPIVSFQTTFDFVKAEIEKFRSQNMSHTCFTVLHPWAYDLDLVDFKYVINKDQTVKISEALSESVDAQVFWLSYFKSQLSCTTDEFVVAFREVAEMNNASDAFEEMYDSFRAFLHQTNFVVNINDHKHKIIQYIQIINLHSKQHNILHDQVRLRQGERPNSEFIDESKLSAASKPFSVHNSKLIQLNPQQVGFKVSFKRTAPEQNPGTKQPNNLFLKFTNVDTEELKDLEIKFDGNLAQFKVGEGDCNHYIICNDKKLWESQFMILNKDGKYYIRDLGIVHTSRVKVNAHTQLQIHQGALLDLGKVVHYHVDKLLHEKVPTQQSNPSFILMKGSQANYRVDDEAILRARPTWISADENKDLVQNEIILENSEKNVFSVGRSNKRDVEIKLKAVSADHCKIEYKRDQGWFIHEKEKDRLSSNGTFVFMKSLQQMEDHEPSDFIPLFDGMTISFINYELQVRIEPKSSEELSRSVATPVDDILSATQKTEQSFEDHQPNIDSAPSKQSHLKEKVDKKQHEEVYHEELQATHNQKSQPQFIEEQKSARSHVSDNQQSAHVEHHDEEDHKSHDDKHESHHSHQSSKHSLPAQDQDDVRKSTSSLQSNKHEDADEQYIENQHSHHHHDEESKQEDQNTQLNKDASNKSLRQSVQSVKGLVVDDQQDGNDSFQVHDADADKNVQQIDDDVKSQKSQKSAHKSASKHDHIEDHAEQVASARQSHQSIHDDEEEKHSSAHKSVHDQLEDSPKAISKASLHKDDDEKHEMQRSYSQHHIAEILDQANAGSEVRQSKHVLIHSDDEEDKQPAHVEENKSSPKNQTTAVVQDDHHSGAKSNRSHKSVHNTHQDEHQDSQQSHMQDQEDNKDDLKEEVHHHHQEHHQEVKQDSPHKTVSKIEKDEEEVKSHHHQEQQIHQEDHKNEDTHNHDTQHHDTQHHDTQHHETSHHEEQHSPVHAKESPQKIDHHHQEEEQKNEIHHNDNSHSHSNADDQQHHQPTQHVESHEEVHSSPAKQEPAHEEVIHQQHHEEPVEQAPIPDDQ